jgi:hypothetical protein
MYATIVAFCLTTIVANAQFLPPQPDAATGNSFGQTDPNAPPIESIGIGDFAGNTVVPLSALHINTNFLPPALPTFAAGEVFRTDCPRDASTFWRMERIYSGAPTEYGMLYSLNIAQDALYFPGTGTGEGIHYYV